MIRDAQTIHKERSVQGSSSAEDLRSYRRSLDRELRIHDTGLEDYANALSELMRRQKHSHDHSGLLSRASVLFDRHERKERRFIKGLLKSWRNERAPSTGLPGDAPGPRHDDHGRAPAVEHLRALKSPHVFPVAVAACATVVWFLAGLFVPGSISSGLLSGRGPLLPATDEGRSLVLNFVSPINDEQLTVNVSTVDTRRFQLLSVQDYVVQPGDSLSGIAGRFNLNVDTILSFNTIPNPRSLRVGATYRIPNRNGLMYKVGKGDSLASVAKRFETDSLTIIDGNDLRDDKVQDGMQLFIPEARMNPTDLKMILGELFMWPTYGSITSTFGWRQDPFSGQSMFHNGVDIANDIGTPVRAALAGKVVAVEPAYGTYGKAVIISHGRGFQTLYGHLSAFGVQVGQYVSQGQFIARMGNTGKSTGPHTHFSVIKDGVFVNPLRYLK